MPSMRAIDKNRLACIVASLPEGAVVTTISCSMRRRSLYVSFIADNRHQYANLSLEPQVMAKRDQCCCNWTIETKGENNE